MKDFHYKRTENNSKFTVFSEVACMTLIEVLRVMKCEKGVKKMEILNSNNFMTLSIELSSLDNNFNDLLIREFLSKFRRLERNKIKIPIGIVTVVIIATVVLFGFSHHI